VAQTKADLLREIKKLKGDINQLDSLGSALTEKQVKQLEKYKKQIVEAAKAVKEINKDKLDSFSNEESSIKSMASMYGALQQSQKQSLDITYTGQSKNVEASLKILDINRSISQLTPDDEYQRAALMEERNVLMDSLDKRSKGLVDSLKEQNSLADTYANLSENQKRIIQGQHDVLDGIKNTLVGTIETAVTLYGNLQGAIGGIVTGMGFVVDKIGAANRELGTTLFQTDGVARKAGVLSFLFDDAVQNVKDLSAELGNTSRATFETQQNVGLMSMNMGITGSEASSLVGSFTRLNGNSTETAFNMAATSREFAKQNGIIPSQLMADLASSAEEFATFGKQGGKNILEAAGYAARLGTNMKTLSGISEGLLDFESSITKELELGAMLGRNINLNRARALAYEGDIAGATKETIKQLGGIEAFNQMDYFQKKQTADLLGVSVAELQKMATNMENAGTMGSVINEKFSAIGEYLNGGLNKYLGTSLKGLGGMITASAQLGANFSMMGFSLKGIGEKFGGIGKAVSNSKIGKGIGSLFSAEKPKIPQGEGGGGFMKSITDGMEKMNPAKILAGAAALVIVAGAVFVFGKAVQEFMKVSWSSVGMAVVSMLALVGAVALLGAIMSSGVGAVAILAGAAAMLVVAGSVYILGKAIQEIATGFEMLGSVSSFIGDLVSMTGSILILSGSLFALSASLAAVGSAGLISIPGLVALGAIGAAVKGINSLLGITPEETGAVESDTVTEYQDKMLSKFDELIQVTKSTRDIYMDRDKVTNVVMNRSEVNSINKFSLNSA